MGKKDTLTKDYMKNAQVFADAFNHFYHETKILTMEDAELQAGYIKLLDLTRGVLSCCINLLGFEAPERM